MSSTKEESSGRGWAGLLCGGDEPSWQSMPDPVILHSWERFPGSCTANKQVTTPLLMEFVSIRFQGFSYCINDTLDVACCHYFKCLFKSHKSLLNRAATYYRKGDLVVSALISIAGRGGGYRLPSLSRYKQ